MRYIVVSEKDMREDGKDILIHELSHVRKGHSPDLILTDLLILFQWFNPAVVLKQSIQQVHEFRPTTRSSKQALMQNNTNYY